MELRSLSAPKEQGGGCTSHRCPLAGFIMVQLLCAQSSPTTSLLSQLTSSQFIRRTHCLAGLGLLFPTNCTEEVETGTAARSLLPLELANKYVCFPASSARSSASCHQSHLHARLEQLWLGSKCTTHLDVPLCTDNWSAPSI